MKRFQRTEDCTVQHYWHVAGIVFGGEFRAETLQQQKIELQVPHCQTPANRVLRENSIFGP